MAEPVVGKVLSDRTAEEATRPLINVAIAFIVVDTAFVVGRTVSRHRFAKLPFWWDDFWVFPTYVLIVALAGLGIAMSKVEVATHNVDAIILDFGELSVLLKMIYAFIQLLLPSFAFTRYSILALYLRIFSDKGVRRATWVLIGFVTVQYFAFAIAALNMCRPTAFFWDRTLPGGGQCFNIDDFYRSITIPNIVVDVVTIVLPIPTVWQLKSTNVRKWALTFVFCIGTMALVASAIRLWIYETHTGEVLAPQYTNVLISWLIIEPSIYLIAACLPAMHHIFAATIPKRLSSWFDQRMAARKHPLSDTAMNTNASQASRNKKGAIYGDYGRLTDGADESSIHDGNTSTVEAQRSRRGRNGRRTPELYELEEGNPNAIVVTTEVIVTQEEKIAEVIGF